jgi:hypothetical protein
MTGSKEKPDRDMNAPQWGAGIAIGIAVGIAMGTALGNVGVGIALGVAFAVAFSGGTRRRGGSDDGAGAGRDDEP